MTSTWRDKVFKLHARSIGRSVSDDDWQTLEPLHILAWEKLSSYLQISEFNLNNEDWRVSFDLSAAVHWMRDHYTRYITFSETRSLSAFSGFDHSYFQCDIRIQRLSNNNPNYHLHSSFAECLIHEAFLAMNLSNPGSCDLWDAYITEHPPTKNIIGKNIESRLNLNNHMFEMSLYIDKDQNWLKTKHIELERVQSWIKETIPTFTMIPTSPAARALIAALHIAREDSYNPVIVIWIFYALESLYQCRSGENINALIRRISLLLDPSLAQEKTLRKKMRKLYDIRSGFVHGGLTIAHPMRDEVMDKRVNNLIDELIDLINFGTSLIVQSLQECILRNSNTPCFKETISWSPDH